MVAVIKPQLAGDFFLKENVRSARRSYT